MARVGIALGSNLGDRSANLCAAIQSLRTIATIDEPFLVGRIYQTEPRFCPPDSPEFLNTVVEIDYRGNALDLLASTQAVEIQLGRVRGIERNIPRVIDIDILYCGHEILDHPLLTLPHPRIRERRFVLQPLADIHPDLILPGETRSVSAMLDQLDTNEAPLVVFSKVGA